MRITYVCADQGIPLLGHKGASAHVRQITGALSRRGHEVTVVCARIGSGNAVQEEIVVHELGGEPEGHVADLASILQRSRADVVLERYSLDSGPARVASRDASIPLILEVNAPLVLEAARHRGLSDVAGALAREQEIFASMDAALAVSAALVDYIHGVAPGAAVHLVANGVDPALFSRRNAPSGPVVGFVGSMKPWHGVQELLSAFAQLLPGRPDARLVLVGDGPERAALCRRVLEGDLAASVSLVGPLSQADVPAVMAEFSVAVAPYQAADDFYFSPLKVLEYLAAGVPVVYPDLGELAATVGSAGLCYPAGNTVALAAAIERMLGDETLRRTCAAQTRDRVRHRSWDAVAAAVEGVIESALGNWGPARR